MVFECIQPLPGEAFEIGGKHLKLRIQSGTSSEQSLTAMWFHYPEPHDDIREMLRNEPEVDIAGTPRLNHWNGRETVEFTIRDLRPSQG